MKTIRELIEEKNAPNADYGDAFHDCESLVWEAVGSYRGDYFCLVKSPEGKYGFTVIGYGSCSGCDAMRAAKGYGDREREKTLTMIIELLERQREATHWEDSKEAMAKWLTDKCDREMKSSYLSDRAERAKVWGQVFAALDAKSPESTTRENE